MRRSKRNIFIKSTKKDKHKINEKIRAQEVRLISNEGEQIGIVQIAKALEAAKEEQLDLVEIAPQASPVVCKLIDYGKYKYQMQKKEAEAKKNQQDNAVKELKLRYRTDIGDIKTKLKQARKFLANGNKVKFSMRFRGREKAFVTRGRDKLEQVVGQLSDISDIYERNFGSRSQMHVILTPES